MHIKPISAAIVLAIGSSMLTGCGGGGSTASTGTTTTTSASATTINGQVVDAPIANANVCVYVNGTVVKDSSGTAICATTDANGNYTLSIPGGLIADNEYLNLIATKGSNLKFASAAGTMAQVNSAVQNGVVSTATLPSVKVTNQTTAEFALADKNQDGTVDQQEAQAFDPTTASNQGKVGTISTLIKACVDGNQCGSQSGKVFGSENTLDMSENAETALNDHSNLRDGSNPTGESDHYLSTNLNDNGSGSGSSSGGSSSCSDTSSGDDRSGSSSSNDSNSSNDTATHSASSDSNGSSSTDNGSGSNDSSSNGTSSNDGSSNDNGTDSSTDNSDNSACTGGSGSSHTGGNPGSSGSTTVNSTGLIAGQTYAFRDTGAASIVTFNNDANQSATLVSNGSYQTGTWNLDTTTNTITLTVSGAAISMKILSITNNDLHASINGKPEELKHTIPVATGNISGKTMRIDNRTLSFNSDGTGLETPVSCSSSGAHLNWSIDGAGAIVSDETGSCTGTMSYIYLLEREYSKEWKVAGYSIVPATGRVIGIFESNANLSP